MIDTSNDLCGTVRVDGKTIKVVKVNANQVLTTQDNPINIKSCSCGGFYLDDDVFHVISHTITLKEKTEVNQGFTICGGIKWDAAVFKQEDGVMIMVLQQPEEDNTDAEEDA